ncbi:MAG: peptidoglycan glycosyltransferase [Crocinitomicaceae bacterium]|nr:peptidoglycan glycosyltransferase [Crocinitomicaceae bacterium]MBT6029472.1 peptidoglycan glycosyltransferase [Crocinitomicaceae bacterium]
MDNVQNRKFVILAIFILIGVIYIFRLFYIQILDEEHKNWAITVSQRSLRILPDRGNIFDRNGVVLVGNEKSYDLCMIPTKFKNEDSVQVCKLLNLSFSELRNVLEVKGMERLVPQKAISGLSINQMEAMQQQLVESEAFVFIESNKRVYPQPIGAHILGFTGIIQRPQLDRDTLNYYREQDFVGRAGIEKTYEEELRGLIGFRQILKDNKGQEKQLVKYDTAIAGNNITLTLDASLQEYGERLMANKIGSIVAIEPATGEILSMVSAPSYDPNLFSGDGLRRNYDSIFNPKDTLQTSKNKAIYNDTYRPGSIFKLVQALVAMQAGVIDSTTGFSCTKVPMNCHNHPHPSNVKIAIQHSCNPYFYNVYRRLLLRGEHKSHFIDSRIGLTKWESAIKSFGLGAVLHTDIPGIKSGNVPDTNYYDNEFPSNKAYGKNKWAFSMIYSNAIGEGEIGVAPIQMANLAAIIANKGWYYTPHFVKGIGKNGDKKQEYKTRNYTAVEAAYFSPVIAAMEDVVQNGTARRAQIDSVKVCGKTGTVENKSFNDHSVFIAFAPRENPKIAIAVYVEFGTWGGTWAAPIASLMMEKYLRDTGYLVTERKERSILKEQRALKSVILNKHAVIQ